MNGGFGGGGFGLPQILLGLFGLVFIAFGLAFILGPLRLRSRRRTWTGTKGVIDSIDKRSRTDENSTRRWLEATYHYTDGQGVQHHGKGTLPANLTFGPDADERTMDVLYDPRNPGNSMPATTGGGAACGIVFGAVFAAVGAGMIWFALMVV